MKNQWLSQARLNEIQTLKLKKLLEYAYDNVDYYRRLFDEAGIAPYDIQTFEDIQKIPITTRADIRKARLSEVLSKTAKINTCIKYTTSGTTDEPLEIYLSKDEEALQGLFHLRMLFANGYKIHDKVAILTHPQFITRKKKKAIFQRLGIFDIEYMSIFQDLKEQIEGLIRIKPDIIKGYTPVIKAIALEIKARDIKAIRPRLIFCTAEFLKQEDQGLISDVFEAEVVDYYSAAECSLIGWECRQHAGYHINSDNVIVEIMNNGKIAAPGERGEVILTNLNLYTMPFIRYKIGDDAMSTDIKCPCGRELPLIRTIFNREFKKETFRNENL